MCDRPADLRPVSPYLPLMPTTRQGAMMIEAEDPHMPIMGHNGRFCSDDDWGDSFK